MTATIDYTPSTHTALVGGKEFVVKNLIPVFTDDGKRNDTKQKIENALYGIFRKYIA